MLRKDLRRAVELMRREIRQLQNDYDINYKHIHRRLELIEHRLDYPTKAKAEARLRQLEQEVREASSSPWSRYLTPMQSDREVISKALNRHLDLCDQRGFKFTLKSKEKP